MWLKDAIKEVMKIFHIIFLVILSLIKLDAQGGMRSSVAANNKDFNSLKKDLDFHPPTSIAISPNPASNRLKIVFMGPSYGPGEIRITDCQGRLMKSWITSDGTLCRDLDISEIPGGVYFLGLLYGHRWETHKVIIQ